MDSELCYQVIKKYMNGVLNDIITKKTVVDGNNRETALHSEISKEEGEFLQLIIDEIKPINSVEIGLAYGVSSLFILDALNKMERQGVHYVFDPYQEKDWRDIGLSNIKKAGFENRVKFYQVPSFYGIQLLSQEGIRIQFAFIDSHKIFDQLLVDFFLLNSILDIGGVIVFDDCGFPGIRKLARLISTLPFYQVHRVNGVDKISSKRRLLQKVFSNALMGLPYFFNVYPQLDLRLDESLGVNAHCIAFKKVSEDNRTWDWYKKF